MASDYKSIIKYIDSAFEGLTSSAIIGEHMTNLHAQLVNDLTTMSFEEGSKITTEERNKVISMALTRVNDLLEDIYSSPSFPSVLKTDERTIENLCIWLISEISDIDGQDNYKLPEILSRMSVSFYDMFNDDRLLNAIYLKDKIGGLELVFDAMYIKGDLSANKLLRHQYLLHAPEDIKTCVLKLIINAQLSDQTHWYGEQIVQGDSDNCGADFVSLCNLYNSLECPTKDITAKFLSLSYEIDSMKEVFDDYCKSNMSDITNDDTARMFMSGYRIFTRTREHILGPSSAKLLALASSLGTSGDYTYWLSAISESTNNSHVDSVEFNA